MYKVFIMLINLFEIKMINTKFGPQLQIRKTSKDFLNNSFLGKMEVFVPSSCKNVLLQSKAELLLKKLTELTKLLEEIHP